MIQDKDIAFCDTVSSITLHLLECLKICFHYIIILYCRLKIIHFVFLYINLLKMDPLYIRHTQ